MRKLAICLMLVVAVTACKKSVKGESSRWKSANQTVDKLAALYPGFKSALEEQRTKAKAAMDAADKIADEKQKIKAMSAANNLLTTGFVTQLDEIDAATKQIRAKLIDLPAKIVDEADKATAKLATQEVERTLTEIDRTLKKGAPNATAASAILSKVTADLKTAEAHLDRVATTAQSKVDAEKAKRETAAKEAAAAKAAEEAAKTWTCEYCDTVNDSSTDTCKNCGAKHEPKAAPSP